MLSLGLGLELCALVNITDRQTDFFVSIYLERGAGVLELDCMLRRLRN